MPITEKITVHTLPPSHPCMTVEAGLRHKGIEYEKVDLEFGSYGDSVEGIYGDGARTVPGMLVGEEPVHGSVSILRRLEELEPANPLYPEAIADQVTAAEEWADGHLQDLGRRLPWGALYFRPESMGTFAGGDALDPAGTDFAMRFIYSTWKHHGITCELLAADLGGFRELIDQIESYAEAGIVDGDEPTAADLQLGSTIRVLLTVGDLHPVLNGTAAERIALNHFPDYPGLVPQGAFPSSWLS